MSDPKRATLITVGAPKSGKNNVNKTVRLTINLVESNESKYPELNYKELVNAEERKKKVENGITPGLDPFSDNDDDVERVARKFEQKYGGKSTYGKKRGRTKQDDFADIGAGYDENDSFIDNTDGYDEMIPPECDTLYGGFYINSGSLEFKNVDNQAVLSDAEPGSRRNKRRISSSSSEVDSSESSSESSQDVKDPKAVTNGVVTHDTEHRKKKNKKSDKNKKAKKIRRTDSSAATSGKQTSDDNGHAGGDSADSRTSQSDSLASKPAPSSENAVTSDSSRDAEPKVEVKLPPSVLSIVEELEATVARLLAENPNLPHKELETNTEVIVSRLESTLSTISDGSISHAARSRVSLALRVSRSKLLQLQTDTGVNNKTVAQSTTTTITTTSSSTKRKADDNKEKVDVKNMTPEEIEADIVSTLKRLAALIDERKPGMIASYNAECARVQEEKKKIQIASADGAPHIEKRLPKRRFPWCPRTRALLARLKTLAGDQESAAKLLANRALPLFPRGFVRMPTLLRQADLSKEIKVTDLKRPRLGSFNQQPPPLPFTEPIQFPSSLTVTATVKTSPEKTEIAPGTDEKSKNNSVFGNIINSFSLSKDLIVEKPDDRKDTVIIEKGKEDLYIPPNNIGSITITPVVSNQKDKKVNNTLSTDKYKEPGLIRVKTPEDLNDMVKKDKHKKDKKRVESPLHVDTNITQNKKEPSPKSKEESHKQVEIMRVNENDLPRPALIPVHHSPTFAKPDKRPPETKKKKEIVIVSDVDPLGDVHNEPVAVDDSSSDVEVIEENTSKSENGDKSEVPSKDKVSRDKKVNSVKHKGVRDKEHKDIEEATKEDIDKLMKNISEMEHVQEPHKLNSNPFGGLLNNARHDKSSSSLNRVYVEPRDKLTNFFEQNGWL
ncbi:yemanuclein isoform X2 [Amyelois transitella]|uniref:yemanuclein isoform X2 n=1 Tax=Amyelois transitella TaxID=680683 RepID=UPI00299072BB|nr:yemanuclein isoform X2 [Amyelois transitella]